MQRGYTQPVIERQNDARSVSRTARRRNPDGYH
jgi:hypothetical protein